MKDVDKMSLSELKYQAKKIDWAKIPVYNHPDWTRDSINVIQAKMKKVFELIHKGEDK